VSRRVFSLTFAIIYFFQVLEPPFSLCVVSFLVFNSEYCTYLSQHAWPLQFCNFYLYVTIMMYSVMMRQGGVLFNFNLNHIHGYKQFALGDRNLSNLSKWQTSVSSAFISQGSFQRRLLNLLISEQKEQKNPERVAAGLKATLHNPTVSAEAKSRAQARLKEMGVDPDIKTPSHKAKEESKTNTEEGQSHDLRHEENVHGYEVPEEHRILGGYKATLKS
jgi:hypothetical protein